jgi:hypothetical protein
MTNMSRRRRHKPDTAPHHIARRRRAIWKLNNELILMNANAWMARTICQQNSFYRARKPPPRRFSVQRMVQLIIFVMLTVILNHMAMDFVISLLLDPSCFSNVTQMFFVVERIAGVDYCKK